MKRIEYERRFIEFLGLKLIKAESDGLFLIRDSENKLVGTLYISQKGNDTHCETMINTDNISFYKNRNLDFVPQVGNYDYYDSNYYHFLIKSSGIAYSVNLQFEPLDISIQGENGTFMCLVINPNNSLYLSCDSETSSHKIQEIVDINLESPSYAYTLNSYNHITKEKESIFLTFGKDSTCHEIESCLAWDLVMPDRYVSERNYIKDSLLEVIAGHELGIEAFNNFRRLLNQIFQMEDVLKIIINPEMVSSPELAIFMKDLFFEKRKDLKK